MAMLAPFICALYYGGYFSAGKPDHGLFCIRLYKQAGFAVGAIGRVRVNDVVQYQAMAVGQHAPWIAERLVFGNNGCHGVCLEIDEPVSLCDFWRMVGRAARLSEPSGIRDRGYEFSRFEHVYEHLCSHMGQLFLQIL